MPQVKIPVQRLRENHVPPNERGFLHTFADKLIARGFRIGKDAKGRWLPDPPLNYDRGEVTLTVSQEVPGRVNQTIIAGLLGHIRRGEFNAIADLQAILDVHADDRASVLAALEVDSVEDAMVTPDSGNTSGRPGQAPDDTPLVSATKLAERELCRRVLLLFGVVEEPL